MKVFEYHFNPKKINGWSFDSFCYEPENAKEKKLGNLYFVGETVSSVEPNFLDDLAQQAKNTYYTNKQNLGPEKKFQQTLKETNNFLQKKIKTGNIDWIDNLNFAALNLASNKDSSWNLNFAKTGNLKILLIRNNRISDITLNLENETTDSDSILTQISPNKILNHKQFFGNIATGKLYQNDKILILTKNVFFAVKKQGILNQISKLSPFSEKQLKKIFKKHKNIFSKISGALLLIIAKPEPEPEPEPELKQKQEQKKENRKQIFEIHPSKIDLSSLKLLMPRPRLPQLSRLPRLLRLPRPQIKFFDKQKFANLNNKLKQLIADLKELPLLKNFAFIVILILVLLIGSFIFKSDERKENQNIKQQLEQIETRINQAESFLIIKENEQAIILFKEIWEQILPLTEIENQLLKQEALSKKKIIEEHLDPLNKIERIEHAIVFEGTETIFANTPENFEFKSWSVYNNNIYFLDPVAGRILKYSMANAELNNLDLSNPKIWLKSETLLGAKSIAVDGSVWILNRDNQIEKYYAGKLQEALKLNFFPELKNPEKIYTSPFLPHIYILEPVQKRIILIDKKGNIKKQFISEKFVNLLDFAVSSDAKTIYLLNAPTDTTDTTIFQIEI